MGKGVVFSGIISSINRDRNSTYLVLSHFYIPGIKYVIQENVCLEKCHSGNCGNVRSENCPFGELTFEELFFRELFVREMSS